MRKGAIWTTNDGQKLDVRWMDSVHLAHSFNLVLRRVGLTRGKTSTVYPEIMHRRMLPDNYDSAPVAIPTERETPDEMCMLNAVLNIHPSSFLSWKQDKKAFAINCPKALPKVWTEYVKLKLTR